MRRFERFAAQVLERLETVDVATLMETLSDDELVRLLVGMSSVASDEERLRRNVVGTELQNRLVRMRMLLDEALEPPQRRDLGEFTMAIAHALRADMACIDEVTSGDGPGPEFTLHGHYRLPEAVMATERCRTSSMAMCDHVLRTAKTLHVPDIGSDPRWRSAPAFTRHGLLHYTGAPGFDRDGQVRCVIWIADRRPHALVEEEIELLDRLAQRVAAELELTRQASAASPRSADWLQA